MNASPPDEPTVSVVICTWNRCQILAGCLDSLATHGWGQSNAWEVVVIDNNSTDETASVVASYREALPIRYALEPAQGITHARNRGLHVAASRIIFFIDDDVRIRALWLEGYLAAIRRFPADIAFLGGAIEPSFPKRAPEALIDSHAFIRNGFCGVDVASDRPVSIADAEYPRTANCVLLLDRLPQLSFDPDLGFSGKSLIPGEEVELFRGLLSAGYQGMWVCGVTVSHLVLENRLRLSYLVRFFFDRGRGQVRGGYRPRGRSLGHVPFWLLAEMAMSSVRLLHLALTGQSRKTYNRLFRLALRAGNVFELCRYSKTRTDQQASYGNKADGESEV